MKTKYIVYTAIAVGLIVISLVIWLLWPKAQDTSKVFEPILLENPIQRTVKGDIICFVNDVERDIIHPILLNKNKLIICKDQYAREVLYEYNLPGAYANHYIERNYRLYKTNIHIYYLTVTCNSKSSKTSNIFCIKFEIDYKERSTLCTRTDFSINPQIKQIGKSVGVAYIDESAIPIDPYFIFQFSDLETLYLFDAKGKYWKKFELGQKALIGYSYLTYSNEYCNTHLFAISEENLHIYTFYNLNFMENSKSKLNLDYKLNDVILPKTCDFIGSPFVFVVKGNLVAYNSSGTYKILDVKGIDEINNSNIYVTDKGIVKIFDDQYALLSEETAKEYNNLPDYAPFYGTNFSGFIQYNTDDNGIFNIDLYYEGYHYFSQEYTLYTFKLSDMVLNVSTSTRFIYFYTKDKVYEVNTIMLQKEHSGIDRLKSYKLID